MRPRFSIIVPVVIAAMAVLTAACGSGSSNNATATTGNGGGNTPAAGATTDNKPVTLTIFAAGTLSGPFNAIDKAFMAKYSNVTVQAQFGGSVKEVKQITELHQQADIVGVADYSVIPKYLYGQGGGTQYTTWYVGFASNALTFVYTDKSKGADTINANNWMDVLSQPGVEIGRSNPDTDPSGYQTLQTLALAETYYKKAGLADAILKNAPKTNIRDTETELLGALQAGQIDYLAIYKSDAIQHHLKYIDLPAAISLSDASQASTYAAAVAHTANGDLKGAPIIYAMTVPNNAPHADWAARWMEFALGPDGQKILADDGFGKVSPALLSGQGAPVELTSLTAAWPAQ